jgi:hypothetical protein
LAVAGNLGNSVTALEGTQFQSFFVRLKQNRTLRFKRIMNVEYVSEIT